MLGVGSIDINRLPEIRRRLEVLIERILRELPAERVILHGSFVSGRVHQGSDIDLIVVGTFPERFVDRVDRVHALNTDRLPIEVMGYTPEEFESMLREGNPFLRHAAAKGQIYGAPVAGLDGRGRSL